MSNGWIKLHRKIIEWEWYDDLNTFKVFMHLLLTANHEERKWRGIVIPVGHKLTSYRKLAKETNLSLQHTRTSLSRLKSTREITQYPQRNYTLIKLNNWESYQSINTQVNTRSTHDQHTDQQQTRSKEVKNIRKEEEREPSPNASIKILDDPTTIQQLEERFPGIDVREQLEILKDWLAAKGRVQKDYVAFARNWLKKPYAQNKLNSYHNKNVTI